MNGAQLWTYVTGKEAQTGWGTDWTGHDVIVDLYRLRYADKLALRQISDKRLKEYDELFKAVRRSGAGDELTIRLCEIADIFECFLHGEPSIHFYIDLDTDRITDVE